ncbi:MAG TPA: hypothetical protein VHY91_00480 [Pirellulales bacterium]|nr:hypothetical protein [Pirellulales bacterium]
MASKLLAPILALVIAVSGIARWDVIRWDTTATAGSTHKPVVLAAVQGCLWSCTSAPAARGRELARRTCGAGQGQFFVCCTALFNRLPSRAAVSSLCSTRTSSQLTTLHQLQVKLQV